MMNRGVMQRPMFSRGVQGLAIGGPPVDPGMMAPPPGMMPPPPMDPGMMPPPPIDPAMEQQLLGAESTGQEAGMQLASDMMTNLDGAEDYQTLIDGIRGNQLPLEARYQELAGLVGENDAMATPESVLALTQPTIMMTEQGAMDSGIGELMQGISGSVDMSGPMEEGVGSLMMAGAGNTPPVNFRQGGPVEVRGYQDGTEVRSGGGSRIMAQAERDASGYEKYFAGGFDQQARAAALEEQNEMAKAQMLFDIAGTALNFAGQTQGNTVAERLANSASQTQLTDKIGARSAGMLTAKQAQLAEDRQIRMAARQASLGQAQTDEQNRQDRILASLKRTPTTTNYQALYTLSADGRPVQIGEYNLNDTSPGGQAEQYRNLTTVKGQNELGSQVFNASSIQPFLDAQSVAEKEQVTGPESSHVTAQANFTYTYPSGKTKKVVAGESFYIPNKDLTKYLVQPFDVNTKLESIYSVDGKNHKALPKGSPILLALLGGENPQWTTNPAKFNSLINIDEQKKIISFTQGFDQKTQERLFANQKLLAAMSDKTTRRGQDLQEQIAEDAGALKLTLQDNEQIFKAGRDQTLQGYKTALQSYGATIAEELQNLKGQQGVEIEKLRAELRDQSSRVTSELSLANQLEVAGVKNVYEINNLATQSERNTELVKLRAVLSDASQQNQNVFNAAESLLNRIAVKENNVLSINARAVLQEASQTFTLNENEKTRVARATDSALARVAALNLQVGSQEHSAALQAARLDVSQSEGLNSREATALEGTLNRGSREALQAGAQQFTLNESEKERVARATEAALARVAKLNLQVGSQEHANALQAARLAVKQSEGLNAREATALEGVLNRASRDTLQASDQEFTANQASLLKDFKGTEAEKKALATLVQNMASNAMEGGRLDLQAARDLVSAATATSKTTLDRERFELEKAEKPLLAAKGTDSTIKALSDQDKLDRYGSNTMNATEANQFDMLIEYWAKKQGEKWSGAANDGQGGYVSTGITLNPALKEAIANRVAILGKDKVPDLSNASNFVVRGAPGSVAAYAFNEDGSVNPSSFNSDNTLIISGVDLSKSTGVTSGFNRVFDKLGSFVKEMSFGFFDTEGGPNSRVGVTRRADAELEALAKATVALGRDGVEGRIFALDIELLKEEVKNFRASAFGTDQGALAQLYVTRASMARQFQSIVDVKNGGTLNGFTKDQVSAANLAMPRMEALLGEYTAAILIYERALNSSSSAQANAASNQVQVFDQIYPLQGTASGQVEVQGPASGQVEGGLLTGPAPRANSD